MNSRQIKLDINDLTIAEIQSVQKQLDEAVAVWTLCRDYINKNKIQYLDDVIDECAGAGQELLLEICDICGYYEEKE